MLLLKQVLMGWPKDVTQLLTELFVNLWDIIYLNHD